MQHILEIAGNLASDATNLPRFNCCFNFSNHALLRLHEEIGLYSPAWWVFSNEGQLSRTQPFPGFEYIHTFSQTNG